MIGSSKSLVAIIILNLVFSWFGFHKIRGYMHLHVGAGGKFKVGALEKVIELDLPEPLRQDSSF